MRHPAIAPDPRPPASEPAGKLTALAASAELACCELDASARIVHRWLRQHRPHDAVVITANGSCSPLSQWSSPAVALPPSSAPTLERPTMTARGEAAASSVTIVVVLGPREPASSPEVEGLLRELARVIAARVDRPAATDTAQLSLAHAVAGERERLTEELTSHFAQRLETILGHLRGAAVTDLGASVESATATAASALVDLRARRTAWRQARRVGDAFAAIEREIDVLAGAAGIRLECSQAGRPEQVLANLVLDAACWITRAAVLNVVEHAEASRGRVSWSVTDHELVVSIVDDGRGFDPQRVPLGGLRAMRRRAEILGGRLEIESVAGWGTSLRACVRLQPETAVRVDESASALVKTLGERELAVLRLVAVGRRNREIASELALSQHTVKFHLANIFGKLGVRSRAEAATVAFAAGIHPRPGPGSAASND